MSFYFIFTVCVFMISIISKKINFKTKSNTPSCRVGYLWTIGLFLICIMGFRSVTVGKDTYLYYGIFKKLGIVPLFNKVSIYISGYPLYRLICKSVYIVFGDNYELFLLITAIIIISGFLLFIKESSNNYIMSILLFILYYMYFNSWNTSRQYLAMSISLIAIVFLFREKKILFAILIICSTLIHNVTAILIILYPLKYFAWNKRKIIAFGMLLLFGIGFIIKLLPIILLHMFPRYYQLYMNQWNSGNMSAFGGIAQGRKALISFFFLTIIMLSSLVTKNTEREKGFISDWLLIVLMLIEIAIGVLLRNNSMLLRIQSIFSPFIIVGIPNIIERMRLKPNIKFLLRTVVIGVMLIPYFIQISENSAGIVPYKMF